jgi:hypothetical protein
MKQDYSAKKISSYDKYQALRRQPSYRKDYWEFFSWCREQGIDEAHYLDYSEATEKAEELCMKYGITYLFNPADNFPEFWESGFSVEENKLIEIIYPTEYRYLTKNEIEKGNRPQFLPIPVFDKGHKLSIKIDLTADTGSIIEYFIEQLKYFQSFLPNKKSRMAQDRVVDKWEVWDAYNETKFFQKAVAKLNSRAADRFKLLTSLGVPAEAPPKINVSTARKAYYRAFELVNGEKFDPDKHKPGKLPIPLRRTCDQCPKYSSCEALCPEALEYASQDRGKGRESPMPEQKLDLLFSLRPHRTRAKPTME